MEFFFFFGLNDKESFDNIKEWICIFNELDREDACKILIGKKCDLEIDKELDKNITFSNLL